MADQHRWFKLWCTAPADDSIQELSPALRWAWAAFGCYTKAHGTRGRILVSATNGVLAAEMGVTPETLLATIRTLPHVHIEEGHSANGTIAVTWQNWTKYQEDSTVAQRVTRLRSKRRGDETRREETRKTPPVVLRTNGSPSESAHEWPPDVADVYDRLVAIQAPPTLLDPEYWLRIHEWLGPEDSGVAYLPELDKYLAWVAGLPKRQQRRDHRRGFRNWLSKAERWAVQEKQRHAQGQAQAKVRR